MRTDDPTRTFSFRRPPPMHALEAFDAAARLGTFAQAADELCVTQSAISHRIRLLESHLGVPLFVRVHRQVVLTPDGERFLVGVREAMRQLDAASAAVGGRRTSSLRITASPAIATQLLIPGLSQFMAAHPGLSLEIDTSTAIVDLAENGFDLALRFGTGPWPGVESELLLTERVVALASPAYAAAFGAQRTPAALAKATLIHSAAFSWSQWLRAVGARVPVPAGGVTLRDVRAALDAAAHGVGVVLANQLASMGQRRSGELVPFVASSVDMRRHYYAVYARDAARLPAIRAFLDWLRPSLRAVSAPALSIVRA